MKTIFITGSTDGIGKSAALQLAQLNHHLILHGRNSEKLRATIEEIKLKSKNQNVTGFLADLGDLEQTKRLASEISNAHSHIDVLINNAGVWHSKQEKDTNNLDMRFVVNYLSPLVLTNMLLPLLKKSDNPLLLNLSSAAQSRVSLQALIGMQSVSVGEAYAQSKLALTMWTG
ncbi:MAG: SDR family NAD(P)-dependent oxidoreductase, partial [Bacteroidota bacterium]